MMTTGEMGLPRTPQWVFPGLGLPEGAESAQTVEVADGVEEEEGGGREGRGKAVSAGVTRGSITQSEGEIRGEALERVTRMALTEREEMTVVVVVADDHEDGDEGAVEGWLCVWVVSLQEVVGQMIYTEESDSVDDG